MKKATKSIGIVLIALLLVLCIAVGALAVRYSTVITRFWSGTYGSVQTDTDDTQLKATDAAAELTQIIAEEGIVLMKNYCFGITTRIFPNWQSEICPHRLLLSRLLVETHRSDSYQ